MRCQFDLERFLQNYFSGKCHSGIPGEKYPEWNICSLLEQCLEVEDVLRFQEESGSRSIWKGFLLLQSRLNRCGRIRVLYIFRFTRLCEFDSFHPKNNLLCIKYLP